MNRLGYYLLSICGGIVIGLLLGYTFFRDPGTQSPYPTLDQSDTSDIHQYFYRLNDSLVARHTVSVSDSGVMHHVDTVAVEPK